MGFKTDEKWSETSSVAALHQYGMKYYNNIMRETRKTGEWSRGNNR